MRWSFVLFCMSACTAERGPVVAARSPEPLRAAAPTSAVSPPELAPSAFEPRAAAPSSAPPPIVETGTIATPIALPLPAFEIEMPRVPGEPLAARPTGLVAASAADEELARWNVGGSSDPEHASNRPGFHPAVRVTVDVRPLRRLPKDTTSREILTERRLLAVARNLGYWPFRACFEAALRADPKNRGGLTRIRVGIGPSGVVYGTRFLGSELRDPQAAHCLERAARRLRFSPAPRKRLDVDLSVEVWPGDAPLPAAPPPKTGANFDVRAVLGSVEARGGELAACCAAGLARDARLWGRTALTISVGADGRVQSARETETRFPDADVVACFARELGVSPPVSPAPATGFEYALGIRCGAPPAPPAPLPIPAASVPAEPRAATTGE